MKEGGGGGGGVRVVTAHAYVNHFRPLLRHPPEFFELFKKFYDTEENYEIAKMLRIVYTTLVVDQNA